MESYAHKKISSPHHDSYGQMPDQQSLTNRQRSAHGAKLSTSKPPARLYGHRKEDEHVVQRGRTNNRINDTDSEFADETTNGSMVILPASQHVPDDTQNGYDQFLDDGVEDSIDARNFPEDTVFDEPNGGQSRDVSPQTTTATTVPMFHGAPTFSNAFEPGALGMKQFNQLARSLQEGHAFVTNSSYPPTTSGGDRSPEQEVDEDIDHQSVISEEEHLYRREENNRPETIHPRSPVNITSAVVRHQHVMPQKPAYQQIHQPQTLYNAPKPPNQPRVVAQGTAPKPKSAVNESLQRFSGRPLAAPEDKIKAEQTDVDHIAEQQQFGAHRQDRWTPYDRRSMNHTVPAKRPAQEHVPTVNDHVRSREVLTDYDPEQLAQMSFEELHNEDIDLDPRRAHYKPSLSRSNEPLETRLEKHMQESQDQQVLFFQALGMTDWERSGEWFLDRFGGAIRQFTEARKHRRELTQQFDEEVYRRHERVQGKKKCIEDALGGMRSSGQGLLLATPRRRSS